MLHQLFASLSNKHFERVAIIYCGGLGPLVRFHGALGAFEIAKLKTVDHKSDYIT